MIGMRNVLIHDYGAVDLEKVYTVAHDHVPLLLDRLSTLIALLERDVGWTDKDPPPADGV